MVLNCSCFFRRGDLYIAAGLNSKYSAQKRWARLSDWFIHPDYNRTEHEGDPRMYDLALIKLSEPFNQTTWLDGLYYVVNTVCLPSKSRTNANYENATGFGYGTYVQNESPSPFLQKGVFAIRPTRYSPKNIIYASHDLKFGNVYYPTSSCWARTCYILIPFNSYI